MSSNQFSRGGGGGGGGGGGDPTGGADDPDSGTDSRNVRERVTEVLRSTVPGLDSGGSRSGGGGADPDPVPDPQPDRDPEPTGGRDQLRESTGSGGATNPSPDPVSDPSGQLRESTGDGGSGAAATPDPDPQPTGGSRGGDTSTSGDPDPSGPVETAVDVLTGQRGTAGGGAVRDAIDTAVDFSTQGEFNRATAGAVGLRGERRAADDIAVSGPSLNFGPGGAFQEGRPGRVDPGVIDELTGNTGGGLVDERTERQIRRDLRQRSEFISDTVSDPAGDVVADLTGSETAGAFTRGAGDTLAGVATAPGGALLAADRLAEIGPNVPGAIREEGAVDTAVTAANVAGEATGDLAQQIEENPARFAGSAAGDIVFGTAALRGGARAGQAVSNARTRAGADATVDFEDITSERGAEGDLPEFDTDPNAPTEQATDEIRDRAADAPDEVSEAVGTDGVLFRSESERLPGDLEAQRGEFELPGLFTSPDASPLRLDIGGSSRSLPRPRLPRPSDFTGDTQQLSAFPGDRIEGAPDRAAGSGFDTDADGNRQPDPDTAGAQFLDEQAEEGTAFVRPTGDRTTELEAIFPPGSRFDRDSELAVNLPDGNVARLDVFRRRDGDTGLTSGGRRDTPTPDGDGADTFTTDEILDRNRRDRTNSPDGDPTAPPLGFSGSSGSASGGGRSGGGGPSTGGTLTPGGTGGSTPPSEPPTLTPTAPPTSPPTGAPTDPPGDTPGRPPTSGPPRPPSDPPGGSSPGDPTDPFFPGDPGGRGPDLDLEDDEERERLRRDLGFTAADATFGSGIISGDEALDRAFGLFDDE